MSLRKRLLIILMLLLMVAGGITVWSSYRDATQEVHELFDAQLARTSRFILSLAQAGFDQLDIKKLQQLILENRLRNTESLNNDEIITQGHHYELKLLFQIFNAKEELILRSENAPPIPLTKIVHGYCDEEFGGTRWRVFVLWNRLMDYKVLVAERYDVRSELVEKITGEVVLPFVFLLPVLAGLLWLALGQGLKPIKNVTDKVSELDERHLQPLMMHDVPIEIKPLVNALDRLFERVTETFEKERRFTADAAHELRTPLAALRTHVQLLLADDKEKQHQARLDKIMQAIDRASHVVDQLMNLVKYEEGRMVPELKPVDLQQQAVNIAADLAPFAVEKNIDLSVEEYPGAVVYGDAVALGMLIRNLIDNAIRYTQHGGFVNVSFEKINDDALCLNVEDNGPGIARSQYEKVFERFRRGEGHVLSGCGIGLAIVKEIADLHLASIQLSDPEGHTGLRVAVCFQIKE